MNEQWTRERIAELRRALAEEPFMFVAGMATSALPSLLDALESARDERWTAVTPETTPKPGMDVLVVYLTRQGKPRRVRAMWATAAMQAEWDNEWDLEEDDLSDGWFEIADNAEECWAISETVTHYMPLPSPPVLP